MIDQYDVMWCAPNYEDRAYAMCSKLTRTEITARGKEGMRGMRVNPSAPMPDGATGHHRGATGGCIMRNFLGSEALGGLMGGVNISGRPTIKLQECMRQIDVIARDMDGNVALAGGLFQEDVFGRHDVMRAMDVQRQQEQQSKQASRLDDADWTEVLVAKITMLISWVLNASVVKLARSLMAGRLRCLSQPMIIACWAVEVPAMAYCGMRSKLRDRRRWKLLDEPFNPFSTARSAIGAVKLPTIERKVKD